MSLEHPSIRRGEGPGPEGIDCPVCEGRKYLETPPLCPECDAEGEALERPCPADPAGHTLSTDRIDCTHCGASGVVMPEPDDAPPGWYDEQFAEDADEGGW